MLCGVMWCRCPTTKTMVSTTCRSSRLSFNGDMPKLAAVLNAKQFGTEGRKPTKPMMGWSKRDMTYGNSRSYLAAARSVLNTLSGGEPAELLKCLQGSPAPAASSPESVMLDTLLGRLRVVCEAMESTSVWEVHSARFDIIKCSRRAVSEWLQPTHLAYGPDQCPNHTDHHASQSAKRRRPATDQTSCASRSPHFVYVR